LNPDAEGRTPADDRHGQGAGAACINSAAITADGGQGGHV
jgi:hypothetical protein